MKGFAVGRTLFGEASRAWLKHDIDDAQLVARIRDNYVIVPDARHQLRIVDIVFQPCAGSFAKQRAPHGKSFHQFVPCRGVKPICLPLVPKRRWRPV